MKLVILTNVDSRFGLTILNAMKARNVRVDAVVVLRQPLQYNRMLFRYVKKRVGWMQAICFGIRRVLHGAITSFKDRRRADFITDLTKLAAEVHYTHGTNSAETIETLERLQPDVVVIGQTGIIRQKLIDIPRFGILNGHPGILPDYRGVDSFHWAILNGEPEKVGCTVHWVDKGVDTGPIIRKEVYALTDCGLMELDEQLFDFASSQLAEVVAGIDPDNPPAGIRQVRNEGKQYYKMTIAQERAVRRKLRELTRSKV